MPNWTYNNIRINKNECPDDFWAVIQQAAKDADDSATGKEFMQSIYPCPQELVDIISGYIGGMGKEEYEAKQRENISKYGYKGWYDWRSNRWGTKWDLCDYQLNSIDENYIEISGNTAWCYPVGFLNFLVEKGCDVENYFTNEDYDGQHKYENGEVCTKYYAFEAKLPFETNKELLGNPGFQLNGEVFVWESEVKSSYEAANALINANLLRPEDITTLMNSKNFEYGQYDTINQAFVDFVNENYYDDGDNAVTDLLADLNDVCDQKYCWFEYKFEEYL
jgi:hypothetical protein